jgi:Domain of unknown function (DUF4331)
MPTNRSRLLVAGPLALAAITAAAVIVPTFGAGSSHREAPKISKDPTADNTDVYFFTSPDKPDTATVVSNFIPFEEPAGGPNFFGFNDDVRYSIKVDNTGDGHEDITYEFRFHTKTANPNTFLYNTGQITYDPQKGAFNNLSVVQTYDVKKITWSHGRRVVRTLGRNLLSPPNNVGPKSIANYNDLVQPTIYTLKDGTKVFAGQRDDPFYVDLGSTFDLINLDKPGRPNIGFGNKGGGDDGVTGYNVHTIALQIPKWELTNTGKNPTDANDPNSVVGVYSTAERPVVSYDSNNRASVKWQQVSRLAEPLINEVVIPLGKKDLWNASDPADDSQFANNYRNPELAADINLLFPAVKAPEKKRDDLVAVLLTGLPPGNPFKLVTQIGKGKPAQADLLRLNLAVPSTPPDQQNRLGVLAGQADGFPNGRRLVDDIVDIEEQAVAGVLVRPMGETPPLGDGVDANDLPFLSSFPYVAPPVNGFAKNHIRPSTFPYGGN